MKDIPMNATLADLLVKPDEHTNIWKIHKMIKSIVGLQECVGSKHKHGTGTGVE
jgi:hypothetical protein